MKVEKLISNRYFRKVLTQEERTKIVELFKDKSYEKVIGKVKAKSSLEFLLGFVIFAIIVYIFFADIKDERIVFAIVIGCVIVFLLLEMILGYFFRFANLKSFVFINLMNCFSKDFKYALNFKYYNNAIEDLLRNTSLLEEFNTVDYVGDSVNIEVKNNKIIEDLGINRDFKGEINIVGARVATSMSEYKYDGSDYYEDSQITNNHYFVRIRFPNAKNLVENEVQVKQKVSRGLLGFVSNNFEHILFVMIFTLLYGLIIYGLGYWSNIQSLIQKYNLKPIYSIVVIYCIFFLLFWYLYQKLNFSKKNIHKIKIRENKFDKIFDSYCSKENYYKNVFRKGFIPQLLKFSKIANGERQFTLVFFGDEIYIKYRYYHIGETFWGGAKSTIVGYILFYLDIRNVLKLALDLQEFYYK